MSRLIYYALVFKIILIIEKLQKTYYWQNIALVLANNSDCDVMPYPVVYTACQCPIYEELVYVWVKNISHTPDRDLS